LKGSARSIATVETIFDACFFVKAASTHAFGGRTGTSITEIIARADIASGLVCIQASAIIKTAGSVYRERRLAGEGQPQTDTQGQGQ